MSKFSLCLLLGMLGFSSTAFSQEATRSNPFACYGAAESLVQGLSAAQIADLVKSRLEAPPSATEGTFDAANWHCTNGELMRRVGDTRAAASYAKVIEIDPQEPGWELWYGLYLRNTRGAAHPLLEQAEVHYYAALAKLSALAERGAEMPFDATTKDWVQRGLNIVYGEAGLPLFGRAYPYDGGKPFLSVAFTSMLRTSVDTNEAGTVDDVRRFASEASFSISAQRLNRALTPAELEGIVRTPLRLDFYNRLRLRLGQLGAIDVSYDVFRAYKSQITRYTEPNNLGDVSVEQAGLSFQRTLDLYSLFDLHIEGGYRRVSRVGVVEWFPDLRENINMYEAHPAISRFLGPDKLTVGMHYVFMDIPFVPGGLLEDRFRERAIRAFYFDYAFYRPLVLPDPDTWRLRRQFTRGVHVYGGYAMDDEVWGIREVQRRDTYLGSTFKGFAGFDLTLQLTTLTSLTDITTFTGESYVDPIQTNKHFRSTAILLYRIVDEDTMPGMPASSLAMMNLVFPVRADFTYKGWNAYENVRAGAELWSKFVWKGLRGTNFLLTAGYDIQYFHRVERLVHMGHLDLRMGWNYL
ncbi:MAG: hypothetical protein SF187_14125 [Deltaproteobacteria bacterium]|nr:hypothetical protein [Deltaproteobacteria bacterium]